MAIFPSNGSASGACAARSLGGSAKVEETQELPDLDDARHAELRGVARLTMKSPGDVERVWREASPAIAPW
ncbi:MAG: hypothetical protein WBQ17_02070 [Rhizomicrobium sp.]